MKPSFGTIELRAASESLALLTRIKLPAVLFKTTHNHALVQARLPAWFWLPGLVLSSAEALLAGVWTAFVPAMYILPLVLLAFHLGLTRFFHFDGLCDCADAFLCDTTRERRLAIMKDSRTGSFALGIGGLWLIAGFLVVQHIMQTSQALLPWTLIGSGIAARSAMAILAWKSHYPRQEGLGQAIIGYQSLPRLLIAIVSIFAVPLTQLILSLTSLWSLVAPSLVIVVALAIRRLSNQAIGGVTGDTLGASCELSWLAFLAAS